MNKKFKIEEIFQVLCINLIVFLVLFIGLECVYRRVNNGEIYQRCYPGQYHNQNLADSWEQYDREFGWITKNHELIHGKDGVTYKANRQGFRDDKDFYQASSQLNKIRIMVLGDSMVFGLGVRKECSIPELLQGDFGEKYSVYNLGVCGWGIDQMYLAYKKYYPVIKPNIVILFFIDDDVLRTFEAFRRPEQLNKPSFDIKDGALVLRKRKKKTLLEQWVEESYVLNKLFILYRNYHSKEIAGLIFKKMMEENGKTKFIIIRLPILESALYYIHHHSDMNPQFNFKDSLNKKDVVYIDMKDYIKGFSEREVKELYLLDKWHFSIKGNIWAAQIVSQI